MWKAAGVALVVLFAALFGYIIHIAQTGGIRVLRVGQAAELSYADLVAILLTAYGIILALAGIALAVAGVVGWNSIEAKAMKIAEDVTKLNIDSEGGRLHLLIKDAVTNEESPLHRTLKAEIQRIMFEGVLDVENDDDEPHEANEPTDKGAGTQPKYAR